MRPLLLLICCTLVALRPAHAQLLDSIARFAQEPPRVVVRLDMRGSFISNSNVRFVGAKLALEHARRFQYGLGYSFLLSPVEQVLRIDGVERTGRLHMGYVAAHVDYAFYQRGPWEVRIPLQVGFGHGSVIYTDGEGAKRTWRRSGLVVYEPAMTVQYRFARYFGIGAGWGYRLVGLTREGLGERLTAPIYILGLRVFFGDIWRDMRRGEE